MTTGSLSDDPLTILCTTNEAKNKIAILSSHCAKVSYCLLDSLRCSFPSMPFIIDPEGLLSTSPPSTNASPGPLMKPTVWSAACETHQKRLDDDQLVPDEQPA